MKKIPCTSNHIFGRPIWDKLLERISKLSKISMVIYLKNGLNQTRDYWLITPNQQTRYININIF